MREIQITQSLSKSAVNCKLTDKLKTKKGREFPIPQSLPKSAGNSNYPIFLKKCGKLQIDKLTLNKKMREIQSTQSLSKKCGKLQIDR